jgi:hypothetical protein
VRYNDISLNNQQGKTTETLGFYLNTTGTQYLVGSKSGGFIQGTPATISNLAVQSSYSVNDILTNWTFVASVPSFGFALNVIR